jgi:hypothetical protein
MYTPSNSVVELGQPAGSVLYNLAAFPSGATAVLDRIAANQAGIYAWFRSFSFSDSPTDFVQELMSAIEAPKFQPRSGDISPYYGVTIQSKGRVSPSKRSDIEQAIADPAFRNALQLSLQWSILFQSPLYIGKSACLRTRVAQHLRRCSPLRSRLETASIDIEKSYLLILPVDELRITESDAAEASVDEGTTPHELLFEEIFSRLFNPSFTVRLG